MKPKVVGSLFQVSSKKTIFPMKIDFVDYLCENPNSVQNRLQLVAGFKIGRDILVSWIDCLLIFDPFKDLIASSKW